MNFKDGEKESFIIRDAVHSDISFSKKYLRILNTREFQRLNHIRQLSCEYMVFPTATHTRFAHSVGTYYVMGQILKRLEVVLGHKGIIVHQRQKDLALCSALLHDIGHGPLSHTFERVTQGKDHEQWTLDILTSPATEIHQCIVQEFSKSFLDDLVQIMGEEKSNEANNILDLIRQLVKSQLDADRMDYLLRDAYFTSVTGGNYDLHRIIRSLEVEEKQGRLQICVSEKYLSSLEEYILGRYYMHKEVYQHTLKRQMEGIVLKAFSRAREIVHQGETIFSTDLMNSVLKGNTISVEDYVSLDDNWLFFHIEMWAKEKDEILAHLCQGFLQRRKFTPLHKKAFGFEGLDNLKLRINCILKERGFSPIIQWENAWFYMENHVRLPLYNPDEDNVWILGKDGTLKDISQVSLLLNSSNVAVFYEKQQCYISFPIFKQIYGFDLEEWLFE